MKRLVKICGLANELDVIDTIASGPDALGFLFYEKSPRAVNPSDVGAWTRGRVPESMKKVGVFVNHSVEEIHRVVEAAGLDVVQLHGMYSADDIARLPFPVWRVLHVDRLPEDWKEIPVEALLVDSGTVEMPGGTGVRVDTEAAAELISDSPFPVVLAGGLKAGTVSQAIRELNPDGVDVSSGVEQSPGLKDMQAVRDFVQYAREAFTHL